MSNPKHREWPDPTATPTDRARHIARLYREALRALQPVECARVDTMMSEFPFEHAWLVPQVVADTGLEVDDDFLTRQQLAERAGVKPDTVSLWVHRGDITRYPGGYRWSEVETMFARRRQRRSMKHSDQLDL